MSIVTGLALGGGMMLGSSMGGGGGGGSSNAQTPAPLDPNALGTSSLQTQINLMPQQLAADQQYAGQFTSLNMGLLSQALTGDATMGAGGMLGLYNQLSPQLGQIQANSNTQTRQANINDVSNLGLQATQAFQTANPLLTSQMSSLANQVNAAGKNPVGPVGYSGSSAAQAGLSQAGLSQAGLSQAGTSQAGGGPLLGQLTANASGSLGQMTPLERMEQQQAGQLLASNGALTPAENAQAQDAARSAYADRGLLRSGSGVGAEILDTNQAQYNRLLQNQQLAQGVDASTNAQTNANRTYALGVQNQGQTLNQYNAGLVNQVGMFNAQQGNTVGVTNAQMANQVGMYNAGQSNQLGMYNAGQANQVGMYNAGMNYQSQMNNAQLQLQQQQQNLQNQFNLANMYQSQSQNPYSLVLGQGSGLSSSMGATQAAGQYGNSNLFDPFNSTIMSMYNSNYNAQNAAAISAGNNTAALQGAGLSTIGSLGSAALMASMMCWVAREVFGAESPKWRRFRAWLLLEAPASLRDLYLRRGERFARLISARPQLRAAVRTWMESILAREEGLAYGV